MGAIGVKIRKMLLLFGQIVAVGCLIFLSCSILIAMVNYKGIVCINFNLYREGWLELIITIFAAILVIANIKKMVDE